MNLFLVVYDRRKGAILDHEEFAFSERGRASKARLRRMIDYREQPHVEVVLFEANSYGDLIKTHSRYFKSQREILAGIGPLAPGEHP